MLVALFAVLFLSEHSFAQDSTNVAPARAVEETQTEDVARRAETAFDVVTPGSATAASDDEFAARTRFQFKETASLTSHSVNGGGGEKLFARPSRALFFDIETNAAAGRQQSGGGYTPLSADEKMKRGFKSAFLNPIGYATTGISAALTEAGEEDLPHKSDKDRVADGLSRFAIKFTTRATRTILGSGVYPILFKQDPRYERSQSKNIGKRALHAVSRVFVARGDDGDLQPNYSRFAASFSASAISNLYEQSTPGNDRIGWDATVRRFANSIPGDIINHIVVKEFLPDIIRIIRRK